MLESGKNCLNCNEFKNVKEFRANSKTDDGYTKWCYDCIKPKENTNSSLKKCSNCKNMRKKTSFFETTKRSDGLTKWCKFCHAKRK